VAHTSSWDCEDFDHQPVPDGTYRVYFEMSDGNSANHFEEFTKGSSPMTLTPADAGNFKSMQLSFTP
jgi:hypothetical protein